MQEKKSSKVIGIRTDVKGVGAMVVAGMVVDFGVVVVGVSILPILIPVSVFSPLMSSDVEGETD